MRLSMVIGFTLLCMIFLTADGSAKTITVDDDGESDFSKIQDAIKDADIGDTIHVFEGRYYERIIVDKPVTIKGNGSTNSIIDGGGQGNVIEIIANGVNISHFTITGSGEIFYPYNAGIHITSTFNHIHNVNVTHNRVGMQIWYANYNEIVNSTFWNNSLIGLYLDFSSHNIIRNNHFSFNREGISLYLSDSNQISENNCSNNYRGMGIDGNKNFLINNNCSYNDGGISVYYSKGYLITGNNCSHNRFSGIMVWFPSDTIITNNTSTDNEIGIWLRYYYAEDEKNNNNVISNNTFIGNEINVKKYILGTRPNPWLEAYFENGLFNSCFILTIIITTIEVKLYYHKKKYNIR